MENWFVFPEYLIWLVVAPVTLLLAWYTWRRSNRVIRYWLGSDQTGLGLLKLKAGMRIAALLLLFISLLGPYWGRRMEMINRMGREIFFVVDVSASMMCDDVKPTRLEKVKMEIRKVLSQLRGDKVGIIIFTNNSYVQCPLTEDADALRMFLDLVSTDQFTDQGTNFRDALLMALARFSEESKDKKQHSQCVVLISDGENYGDEFASVSSRMKNRGIKIFPVGIGTATGAQVPNIQNGVRSGFKTGQDGQPVVSRLTGESLRKIADEFGTLYHEISKPLDDLGPLMDQLRMQTASLINNKAQLTSINRYQWPLGFSVLLLGISFFLLPIRRK